ncbi:MAG: hypothetical protein HY898_19195 [Deltaproteobacteria bacterium]|nr:hypothetical protein [Deltaproteobacteria bacterium]
MADLNVLQSAGSWFPGRVSVVHSDSVSGECQGVAVTVSFPNHGCGSTPDPWTEVAAQTDPRGVVLELRPQTFDESNLESRGLVRDLKTGDLHFDETYVVEGAPSDIVLQWLDADLRSQLLGAGAPVVCLSARAILCKKPGWIHDTASLGRLVLVAAALAANLPLATQRANQASAGPGYRGGQAPPPGLDQARASDMADLSATKDRRDADAAKRVVKIGVAVVVSLIITVLGWILVSGGIAAFFHFTAGE